MLDPSVVIRVCAMLAEGLSQREVHRRMNGQIGRGTIWRIANGKRPIPDPPDDPPRPPAVGLCSECGTTVLLPCVACRARNTPRLSHQPDPPSDEGMRLDLRGANLQRYEEIRRGRAA